MYLSPVKDFGLCSLLQLVKLPRAPNADDILKKYLGYRMKKDDS